MYNEAEDGAGKLLNKAEASALLALRLGPLLQLYVGGGPGIMIFTPGIWGITALPIFLDGLVGICSSFGGPVGIYGQMRYIGLQMQQIGLFGIAGYFSPAVGFYIEF